MPDDAAPDDDLRTLPFDVEEPEAAEDFALDEVFDDALDDTFDEAEVLAADRALPEFSTVTLPETQAPTDA